MRELPYMRATNNIEKNQTIERIFERVEMFKKQKIAFASKPINRRGLQTDGFNLSNLQKPYEGKDEYNTNYAGNATFKVRKINSD